MYIGLHVKYPLFLSDFNGTWDFLDRFSKNIQIRNFIKIRPVDVELVRADRRTDMTKLTVAIRNFANAPKRGLVVTGWLVIHVSTLHIRGLEL